MNFGARFGAGRLLVGLLIFEVDLLWILVVWIRHQFSLTKQFSQLPLIFFGTVGSNLMAQLHADFLWNSGIQFSDNLCNVSDVTSGARQLPVRGNLFRGNFRFEVDTADVANFRDNFLDKAVFSAYADILWQL